MTIRPMLSSDLAAVERIQHQCPEAAQWPPADYLSQITYAAERSGTLVGFLVLLDAAGEYEVLNLAIDPACRRQGIAHSLLGFALERHPGRYFLEVRAGNDAARQLYAAVGFIPIGTRPAYYVEPIEDAIVMELQQ